MQPRDTPCKIIIYKIPETRNNTFITKSNFGEFVSKIDKTTEMRPINLRTNILINTSTQQNLSCFLKIFVHH